MELTSWPDLGARWPSRLVATAAEGRLSFQRDLLTSFAAVSDALGIPIDRMAWIDRPTIGADRVVEAAMLNEQRLHAQLSAGAAVPKVFIVKLTHPLSRFAPYSRAAAGFAVALVLSNYF